MALINSDYIPLKIPVRITEQNWPVGTKPLVSIRCMTYNHFGFIQDAIDGFLMQETTFPVEICIHDDASTDGTSEILNFYKNKYPDLIKIFIQQTNTYKNIKRKKLRKPFFDLIKGKFVASCEGDDYWISSLKLENQINLVKKDPLYKFIGGRALVKENLDLEYEDPPLDLSLSVLDTNSFFKGVWLHVNTRLIESCFLQEFRESIDAKYTNDLSFVLYSVRKSMLGEIKIGAIDDIVGVYRVTGFGVWSSKSQSEKFLENMGCLLYHLRKYKKPDQFQKYLINNLNYFINVFVDSKESIGVFKLISLLSSMLVSGVNLKCILKLMVTMSRLGRINI
jgi:glycosyltransferase involved in cell wall biosynthesis